MRNSNAKWVLESHFFVNPTDSKRAFCQKEAILTDEEPQIYRQRPGKYLQEMDAKDSGHLHITTDAGHT